MHDTNVLENQPIAWTPTEEVIERSQLKRFMRQVGVETWDELYQFSIRDVERFTEEVLKFLDIKFNPPFEKLLDTSNGVEFPTWFQRSADTPVRMSAKHEKSDADDRRGWYHHRTLPHFDGEVYQTVTFRLADSIPKAVLETFKAQLEHDNLDSNSDEYRQMVEDYLDKGDGECILRRPEVAEIVQDVLLREAETSIDLKAWVIMPNHGHILFRLREGFTLAGLMKRIKGISARRINQLLGRGGTVWQADYFDRYVRDEKHFRDAFRYIEENPVAAKLVANPEDYRFGSASHRSADTPVRIAGSSGEAVLAVPGPGNVRSRRSDSHADKSVRAPSAGLNITEMCLDRWQTDEMKDQPAVIFEGEAAIIDGQDTHWYNAWPQELTYGELAQHVSYFAAALRENNLGPGDAIAIHLPMIPQTVISLLAIGRIGAIAVPVFSGYGVSAIEARLNAVGARAIITCDGFPRRGKYFKALPAALEAARNSPSIEKVFISVRYGEPEIDYFESGESDFYLELEDSFWTGENLPEEMGKPEPTSAEDPLIILYTSGTTGKPKGIAHTHASFPIKAAQDMAFGTDVGRGTRICWYTDIGWMMGPWLIYGALINGATICLYDGAPDYPTGDRMWEFCAKHKVEVLGISPTLVRALAAAEERSADTPVRMSVASTRTNDPRPRDGQDSFAGGTGDADRSVRAPHERHDLSSLRAFASTGEPWNPAPWWWLFEKVGNSKLPIINYSGGTEIAGGILMGNPLLPIKPCSFPAPCPGMDVDILNENGEPVKPGEVGELVIKQPWIGMARGFWQERERYLETYWSRFKNTWVHGDWAMRDNDGHWFILGRSDDTLKVAGKRVGPAEVESLLVAHPLVTEAAVIGVPDETKGTAMVAFCVLSVPLAVAGEDLHPQGREDADQEAVTRPVGSVPPDQRELEKELKALVAKDMGKPLAPSGIHFVSALPKTRNAKVMRRVIRAAYLNEDAGDLSALENPKSVDEIRSAGIS
jgi:acetyl-CoA synthetase